MEWSMSIATITGTFSGYPIMWSSPSNPSEELAPVNEETIGASHYDKVEWFDLKNGRHDCRSSKNKLSDIPYCSYNDFCTQ